MANFLLSPGLLHRVRVLVTNQSTEGGRPIGATFTVEWRVGLLKRPPFPTVCGSGGWSIGDVNGDGIVNMGDTAVLERIILGLDIPTPEQIRRADVNGDGIVNMGDATLIERFIIGLDTIFPACALPPPAGIASLVILDTFTTEFFGPGEQRTLSYDFSIPEGTPEDFGIAQVTVLAEGQPITKAGVVLEVPQVQQVQTFYAMQDYTVATQINGVKTFPQLKDLPVGWGGGLLMEKTEGVIKFAGLPTNIQRATLVLTPTEYLSLLPGDEAIVMVSSGLGWTEVGRDRQTSLAPLSIDITALLVATASQSQPGVLTINLSPTLIPLTPWRNWLRKYGSIRGVAEARPRIELL